MHAIGTPVQMHDGVWTITERAFVTTLTGQAEVYTLERAHYQIRLTRKELEANRVTH